MSILDVFPLLEEVERTMAKFYLWLSLKFDKNDVAAWLFYKAHLEEKEHLGLLQFAQRYVEKHNKTFPVMQHIQLDTEAIEHMKNTVEETMNRRKISFTDALEIAVQLEDAMKEKVLFNLISETHPFISRLFNALSEDHSSELRDYLHAAKTMNGAKND